MTNVPLDGDVDRGGGCVCAGARVYRNSVLPAQSCFEFKTDLKRKIIFKNWGPNSSPRPYPGSQAEINKLMPVETVLEGKLVYCHKGLVLLHF